MSIKSEQFPEIGVVKKLSSSSSSSSKFLPRNITFNCQCGAERAFHHKSTGLAHPHHSFLSLDESQAPSSSIRLSLSVPVSRKIVPLREQHMNLCECKTELSSNSSDEPNATGVLYDWNCISERKQTTHFVLNCLHYSIN